MPKLFILIITGEDANAYYFHLEHEAILNRPYCFFTLFYKYICLEQCVKECTTQSKWKKIRKY